MASVMIESGCQADGNNHIDQWIKEGVNLVSLIDGGEIRDVDDVRQYLACSSDHSCVNRCNESGQTPLMIACRNIQKDIVTLLLEAGADPNLTCTVNSNSALHYACKGEESLILQCRKEPNYPQDKLCEIIEIVKVLAHHGAVLQLNEDGLSPVCVAALNSYKDVVNFFTSSSRITMPVSVKVRAYELLGVSQAVFDKHHTMDACKSFHLAASLYSSEDSDLTPCQVTLELDTWFVDLINKGNPNESEVFKVKAKAFIFGLQCLPHKVRENHDFYKEMGECAQIALFHGKAPEDGYQMLLTLIRREMSCECTLGTVLDMIRKALGPSLRSPSPVFKYINKLLDAYADGFIKSSRELERKKWDIIETLGELLFNYSYYHSSKYLESSIPSVANIVNYIKRISEEDPVPDYAKVSVLAVFIDKLAEAMWEDVYSGQSKQSRNRLKFTICRLLHYTGFDPETDSSLLVTFLEVIRVAYDMEWIISVARVLIRYGCSAVDITLEDEDVDEDDPDLPELQALLRPPTSPIPLEELSSRALLYYKIPYRERLPKVLCEKIEGEKLSPDHSELYSSPEHDAD